MPDKFPLYMTLLVDIQMKINGGGLKILVAKMVFDIGDGVATAKHIHCPGMSEAVHGINILSV